ncbi:hypothetical protein AALP_AA8G382200 [Arabis alpina]|uniref:non-specific serine/threonine protein kinase n=1 Tax=Arabis alpina TaxID=50452 RepID=A0A087GC35_ARAAL|nr:hypothetical protein AALP_AA8G382200 [Arabis alpina]
MKQYVAEIASMGRLRHRNLVQLLGYCRRKGELLLVYDYMPNGSLDDYLFTKNKLKDLTWSQRLNIINGVASALLYLHEDWEQVVLHRDIKASNILLDADLNGRLGDFGLARFHDRGENLEATRVVGTIGYMAPELTAMGVATTKTDVYAFGAFILEVVCGRRPVDPDGPREQVILVKWVASCGRRDTLTDTVDSKLRDFNAEEAKLLLKLGMICSQSTPESRPSMRQILKYLEGSVSVPSISFDTAGFAQERDHFVVYDFSQEDAELNLDGMATTVDGRLQLTNNSTLNTGHAFRKDPINFTSSSTSFSTEFVFAILPLQSFGYGQGMAFVISPTKDLRYTGDASSYLGIFNRTNDNKTENHIMAVELDTNPGPDAIEKSNNHVGIDINSIVSLVSDDARYFNATEGKNITLQLASGKNILIWIDYDGIKKLLTVTLAPVPTPKPDSLVLSSSIKPRVPLLSKSINLSEIFLETMFVGFSGSTGTLKSNQYILGWSFKKDGKAESLDLSKILDPPPSPPPPFSSPPTSPPPSPPPTPPPPPSPPPPSRLSLQQIIGIISSIAFLLMMLGGIVYLYKKKKYAEVLEQWEKEYSPQRFSFRKLYRATKGFKENQLLGAGGFGKVYKGILPSGTEIAVKRVYHDAEQGMKQYVAEIASMGRLRHKNLVQLLGYCRRKGELLLVYDYMPNGSLDDYLFTKNKLKDVTWSQRLHIIKGVASALLYLHEDWEQVVLHRDIKASNILLDANLNGRLGDFGLARFHDRGENLEATRVVGTIGYMAPELTAMGVATTWTDVYAFGAFILEVVCGRRPVDPDGPREQVILVKWVASCGRRDALTDTVDSKLRDFNAKEAKMLLKLGMICSQSNPENRPSMRQILQYLEGNVSVPEFVFAIIPLQNPPSYGQGMAFVVAPTTDLRKLYRATKGFKENQLLGAGGFGKVYKGILPSGTEIAVKRVYHDAEQGMKQYVAEIASMGRLRHKNLVQLLGYCRRKGELLLVYDYMPNGNLDDYLFAKDNLKDLTWSQRLNIIKGVASSLLYLHEEWEQVVLHRDIKSSNILLDADLNGKLGDFGLARFHDRGKNLEATRVVGTIGYMAPELTAMGVATTWTDVYAFGAFILEVVCGRRPVDPDGPREQVILVKWVASCGRRDALTDTVDSTLRDFNSEEAKVLLKLGMLCSQSNPENRPSMRQILQYVEGNVSVPVLAQDRDQFVHYDFSKADLHLDGMANTNGGLLHLTNNITKSTSHAFHKVPMKFTSSSSSSLSFSTEFVFAIFPLQGDGQGMAFVVSPTTDLRYAGGATSDLGLFNKTNDNKTENHIIAVELDTNDSSESFDKSGNHVGIDINSIVSVASADASYFNDTEGKNISLRLASGRSILIWIDYDGIKKLLNVTLAPVPTPKPVSPYFSRSIKPSVPLLSRSINLSEIFNATMFVGFSGSTGTVKSDQYILGWSFKKGGKAESLDISKILDPPNRPPPPSSPPPPSPPTSGSHSSKSKLILVATIPSIAFLMMLGGILYLYKRKKYAEVLEQWEQEYIPHRYSFKNLYKATNGFKDNQVLGAGGFGKVYKGILPSGTEIAVKRVYHNAEQGMKQYVAEIASMGRLKHKNLVQLLGYCRRKGELLLVYDYMPNGSLDDYLFSKDKLKDLTWSQRLNIIKGVASSLLYLHEEWEQVVLHRDVKASNILLDADLNGRLGDFGLARFHDRGENLEATRVVGTIGYMAPELTAMGVATTKTDVYAFGSFVLEVVCGRRPVDPERPLEQMILLKWVASCGSRDTLLGTVDSKIEGNFKAEEAKLLLRLGMLCSQSSPESRPSMREIIHYLEGSVIVPSITFDTAGFGMPNISSETATQLTTTSSSANFSFEDVTVLFGGR